MVCHHHLNSPPAPSPRDSSAKAAAEWARAAVAGEEAKAAAQELAVLATGGRFAPTGLGMAKMLEHGARPPPRI